MRRFVLGFLLCLLVVPTLAQDTIDLPITDDIEYTLQVGDTLEVLGSIFDVSPSCLQEFNEIERASAIFVGDVITIPVSCPLYGNDARDKGNLAVFTPREVVTFEDDCEGYRVTYNDSLDSIGFELDISLQALALENDLEPPYRLEINQCLIIPDDAPSWGEFPALELANPALEAGGGGIPGEFYVMQPFDTLDVIAQSRNISLQSILQVNEITDASALRAGTAILIPDDAPPYGTFPPATPLDETAGAGGGVALHVVQPRENIDLIAAAYDVDTKCLLDNNGITNSKTVQPGTVLAISADCPAYTGDSDPNIVQVQGISSEETSEEDGG